MAESALQVSSRSRRRRGALHFPTHIPFVQEVGLELWRSEGGESELRLKLDADHMNSLAMAHGGVLMTLLDVAMAHAARSRHVPGDVAGPAVTTVEMKTTFVRPARGALVSRGHVLHRTATMAFCEASVFDEGQHLCAHATGTFKYVRAGRGPGAAEPSAAALAATTAAAGPASAGG